MGKNLRRFLIVLLALYSASMITIAVFSLLHYKHYLLPWSKFINYLNSLSFLLLLYKSRLLGERFYLFFFAGLSFIYGVGAVGSFTGMKNSEWYMLIPVCTIPLAYTNRFLFSKVKSLQGLLKVLWVVSFCFFLFTRMHHTEYRFLFSKISWILYWLVMLAFCWDLWNTMNQKTLKSEAG